MADSASTTDLPTALKVSSECSCSGAGIIFIVQRVIGRGAMGISDANVLNVPERLQIADR